MKPTYCPPPPTPHYSGFDPSSSQLPPHSSPTQPADEDEEMPEAADEHRQLIESEGNTFYPSTQSIHKITNIIRSKYDAPYVSWKKIPPAVRDLWFKEFGKCFYWHPHHQDNIRRSFESRGSARLRDMFTDIRKAGERSLWMGEGVWAGLCAEWKKPEYLKYSEQNRKNRASDCGGMGASLQTGGSVPHTEHMRRLTKILGREPTLVELHQHTHQRKSDQQWVDQRSQKVFDDYTHIHEAHRHSSISEGSNSSSQRSDMDLWLETVGGQKKGRIYGLGSQGKAYASSSSAYAGQTSSYIDEMVQRKYASLAEQMRNEVRDELRAEMLAEMTAEMDARFADFAKSSGKSHVVEEEEEEGEEDENDEDER